MSQSPPPAVVATRQGRKAQLMNGVRLLLLGAAVAAGALAFRDHASETLPWWRWVGELAIGWVLLVLALEDGRPAAESRRRRQLRRAAGVVALTAAAVAVRYGLESGRQIAAIVATLTALLALLAARWIPFSLEDVSALNGVAPDAPAHSVRPRPWRFGLAALAVVACVAATFWNRSNHLGAFLLWLASLALFAVAWWKTDAPDTSTSAQWRVTSGPQLSRGAEAMALLLILTLGAVLRLALLDSVPHIIEIDDGLIGRHAESMWRNGFPDPFGFGFNAYANLSFMVQYVPIQLLGTSDANLRLGSAALGWLSLIPTFFWVRRWWGSIIALLAVLILAMNVEHIQYSRVGYTNIQMVPVAALILAAFARVLHTRRLVDWVWLGYAMGLGFHTYHPAKQYPMWLAVAALFFAIGIRGFLKRYVAGALVGAVAYLLVVAPLLTSIYANWGLWYLNNANRLDVHNLVAAYQANDSVGMWQYLGSHFGDELRRFINEPPITTLLSPAMSVPFLLGVGWILWRWRDPRNLVALAWLGGILFVTGFTGDPRFQRMLGFLPVVALIPALVAGHVRGVLHRCWPRRADIIVVPLLLVWLSADLYHSWFAEFVYRASTRHTTAGVCRVMQRIASPVTYYTAGTAGSENPHVAASICMIADDPERRVVNLAADATIVPIPPTNLGTAVLLVFPPLQEVVQLVRHYYPEVEPEVYKVDEWTPTLYTFVFGVDQIEASRGLKVTFRAPDGSWVSQPNATVIEAPPATSFPVHATGRGLVWISPTGSYGFRSPGASVYVDGRAMTASDLVLLPTGWHGITVDGTLRMPSDRLFAEWYRSDKSEWTAIPSAFLHAHPEMHGLLGRYFGRQLPPAGAAPIDMPPDSTELSTTLSFEWALPDDDPAPPPFAARPSTMEWIGTVDLPEGREQSLRLFATTPTEVFIDGTRVLHTEGGDFRTPAADAIVTGLSGRVPILVRTVRPADDPQARWTMRLLWRAPGGGWSAFVPYSPPEGGVQ